MYDIAIIGGGINGCGIARDAAGRGYSVVLLEKGDLAGGTSSGSTKLIHGGLRYLEHFEFRLVREALKEREVLLSIAPHIIRPMRFLLPHHRGMRPAWFLRLGLFLYDHLARRNTLPGTTTVDLSRAEAGRPLKPDFTKAFAYSDCWVDDARLVVLNAQDARDRGADIRTRTQCLLAERGDENWTLTVRDNRTGNVSTLNSRMIVNAAGPWVDTVLGNVFRRNSAQNVRLVQGSHIVVPKIFDHDDAYIFQNDDGRVLFAIPYENDFTLIGTTDREYQGDPDKVEITDEEIDYICQVAGSYFVRPINRDSIIWHYSALRPLFDDGASRAQEATRDYVLKTDGEPGLAPVVNIFGGKITTYRQLAEAVVHQVDKALDGRTRSWTATAALPGGDAMADGAGKLAADLRASHPFLNNDTAIRLARSYGTLAQKILGDAGSAKDLGADFGAGLTEREVEYLQSHEWAETAEDILWRRSKLGLYLDDNQQNALRDWLADNPAPAAPVP